MARLLAGLADESLGKLRLGAADTEEAVAREAARRDRSILK